MTRHRHVNFERSRAATPLVAAALLFAAVLAGCSNSSTVETAPNAPRPVASAPSATPALSGSTRLTSGPAPLQAVITIDQAKGFTVGNTVIKAGPLPAGHRYELWLDQK